MKKVRKWSRFLHRYLGFLFFGVSIVYGLSGIAFNHLRDWNSNYIISTDTITTNFEFTKENAEQKIPELLKNLSISQKYKTHVFQKKNKLKIYLANNSSILIDLETKQGIVEIVKRRPIFFQVNSLHYNPNKWWTYFSDAFAVSLILFAITGVLMMKGKKGVFGVGGIFLLIGIIIPILILFL